MGLHQRYTAISLLVSFVFLCSCVYAASSNAENESKIYKIVDPTTISTETRIYIVVSLFLGISALVAPYLAEELKRKRFAPKLEIIFELSPPFCHKTKQRYALVSPEIGESPYTETPAYYFRFGVVNKGKSLAKKCEVILENLWIYNEVDKPEKHKNITSVHMNWSITHEKFIDINPNRRYYCDLCHISSPTYSLGSEVLHFVLDLNEILFAQPSSFPVGKYEMQFGLYSENAGYQKICFEVSWSGKWKENEGEMFKEMVIRRKVVD